MKRSFVKLSKIWKGRREDVGREAESSGEEEASETRNRMEIKLSVSTAHPILWNSYQISVLLNLITSLDDRHKAVSTGWTCRC